MAKQTYSLYQLNEYINRVMALNFPEPIWINAEIMNVSESRGNVYLELIEQDEDTNVVKAQISAAIWYKSYLFIKNKVGELLPSLLKSGTHVLLKVRVDFNERYGMKLIVEDIDPAYTIGQLEMHRQKIIERLNKSGEIHKNEQLVLPIVLQKVAIISAETAAGYKDFINHIENNLYQYIFEMTLFESPMQGRNTESGIVSALQQIEERKDEFDVVIIIRGGGSKLDLSSFDNYNIGYKIATFPIPVLTGIGHEIDNTVADLTAHTSIKTPTAVADFLIEHNLGFESKLLDVWNQLIYKTNSVLEQQHRVLDSLIYQLRATPLERIRLEKIGVDNKAERLNIRSKSIIEWAKKELKNKEKLIEFLHPRNTLKRGFVMVRQRDKYVETKKNLKKGKLELEFNDGIMEIEMTSKS